MLRCMCCGGMLAVVRCDRAPFNLQGLKVETNAVIIQIPLHWHPPAQGVPPPPPAVATTISKLNLNNLKLKLTSIHHLIKSE